MYRFGADWTGVDIARPQIDRARRLAEELGQKIQYIAAATEEIDFPGHV